MHEVNVTIAGSVCDVQSTNITHIICVTNAQRQSQETKVRVSVGDQGIAKMVRQEPNFPLVTVTSKYDRIHIKQLYLDSFNVISRTVQISSTLMCGHQGSRGVVYLHQSRALLL